MNRNDAQIDDEDGLRRILAETEALLLDFDGPVCSVFARVPARFVAAKLREVLANCGHNTFPQDIQGTDDPFAVFRFAGSIGPEEARLVEATLRAHEVEAVTVAEPTPYAHELINRWDRPLAIVSNNSVAAVNAYLHQHKLREKVDFIAARSTSSPSDLKPSSLLLDQAVMMLRVDNRNSTMVGDTETDIVAGKSAGCKTIGYVNKATKRDLLKNADVRITSMALILTEVNSPIKE